MKLSGCQVVALSALVVACGRTTPPPPPTVPPPAPVVAPEPPPPTLDEAIAAKAAGKVEEYLRILRTLTNSADAQTRRRALALLAVQENSVPLFEQAADAYPEVAPWLRLKVVELERDSEHFAEAIAAANRIIQEAPASSAATLARLRLPGLYAQASDFVTAETAVKDLANVAIDELTEAEFVNTAAVLDKAGRNDLGAAIRLRLLTQYPQGRFTEQTYAAAPIDTLSVVDALALARKLASQDHYDEALDLLRRIEKRDPKAVTSREYQSFRLRALFNSRHYDDVVKAKKLKDPALMLLRARAAWRADEPKIFLSTLKRIERLYPRSPQAAEAKLLRAKYYSVDEPKLDRAITNLEKGLKTAGAGTEGENLWTLGWTYVLAKRYDDALRVFDRYAREFPDGDYLSNALFWSAKIHEWRGQLEQRDAAFNTLLNTYPYSYYSVRAREILGKLVIAPLEIANGNLFPNVDADIATANEPRLDSVKELTWLGLNREATAEMKAIAAAHPDNVGIAFRLADLYAASGEPFKAILLLQRQFRPFIRHGGTGVPHRFWEILFPLKYWESIRSEAQRRQIDPYLIASIIRQESGFEPTVVSNAGAVGVMQIMPQEAERIASAAGIQTPNRQQLFDPQTNIAIGVAEYAQKLAVMRGTEVLAIAAYNAGEDAVGKWIAQAPLDDIDLFIESIPYNETRLYVKSVRRNRFEYRRIYEGASSSS
ncbi:MAG TPA: transglycosylase SLT domain-containing protein [Thermoanaerobaculia bacterium]|nr:transglycosylase SLT domain-containing protein [Thermoanaerobaculia bacterium]